MERLSLLGRILAKVGLWVVLVPVDLVATLLAAPVALFLAIFPEQQAALPWRWFTTPDNPLNGDDGHQRRWGKYPYWVQVFTWLLRNRAYAFGLYVIGAPDSSRAVSLWSNAETRIGDRRGVEGLEIRWNEDGYWQVYWIKAWGKDRCVRVNLGWKIWGENLYGQYVFAVNPWKSFRGG